MKWLSDGDGEALSFFFLPLFLLNTEVYDSYDGYYNDQLG